MGRIRGTFLLVLFLSLQFLQISIAGETGVTGGLTLLEPSGARPAALGEAFSAASNDITAFSYNPASLRSLRSHQISMLFHRGFEDEFYSQVAAGYQTKKVNFGISLGYFDGGDFLLSDGIKAETVSIQRDIVGSLGVALGRETFSIGAAAKFLNSNLIQKETASAMMVDLGIFGRLSSRLNFGAAIQNLGTPLKYVNREEDLPTLMRAGLSFDLMKKITNTTLFVDAPYHLNEKEILPAVGLESTFHALALRVGTKKKSDGQELTVGMGIHMTPATIDYSFAMLGDFDMRHRVSLMFKFGTNRNNNSRQKGLGDEN
ncbi:hypothetical protein BVX98_03410 [bacterium F11]|nr:hypothetical protein BVX98_03410 [bacterium F11]